MKEDFLHYIWKFKKFKSHQLQSLDGEIISIINSGLHNQHASGPDFFNAQMYIGEQHWAGNVEIHIKSSDWYAHGHEKDTAYQNVILHVVWEHDMDIYRTDETKIPTLVLKPVTENSAENNYRRLMQSQLKWINCETAFHTFDEIKVKSWLTRVFVERLEQKSGFIQEMLGTSKNNWNEVLFLMLVKNFGLKSNGEAFLSLAKSIPYQVLQKTAHNQFQLESLLLGQARLLNNSNIQNSYYSELQKEFAYLQQKFQLKDKSVLPVQFYGARPTNFPTIRLAQLASLFHQQQHLFGALIECKTRAEITKLFKIELSSFWQSHYTFEKVSKPRKKQLSKSFIDLLIINTLVPIQFSFAKFTSNLELENSSINLLTSLAVENNNIVNKFNSLKNNTAVNALESQALIQLKQNYCDKNKCLQCNLGIDLLGR